jgi:hypothetical protein
VLVFPALVVALDRRSGEAAPIRGAEDPAGPG